ncbi:MAG: ribonuclease P protein component [Stellaceae bacterium]
MSTGLVRLKRRVDFLRVAERRRRAVRDGLILQPAPGPPQAVEGEVIRVGFTASRRVGNAVLRNRAKRRLRAAAAEVLARQGRAGTDYVLIARAATPARAYRALVGDLAGALRQLERARVRSGGDDRLRPAKEERNDT